MQSLVAAPNGVCLGVVLIAGIAQAQTYTATIARSGGCHPMGAAGYSPMGH